LEEIGLESQRVHMINISSAMGGAFAESAREMAEKMSELGPNPLKDVDEES
jgi:F420-non-reducing hydrogenase iron-sulfur subunit